MFIIFVRWRLSVEIKRFTYLLRTAENREELEGTVLTAIET